MSLAMTRSEREQFLSESHVGIVSIPREGRGPLTVPVWYDYTPGGDVWIITSSASLKGRLLRDSSRISLCAQTETPPYRYVSIEGPFTTSAIGAEDMLHMATRYLGEEQGRQYAEASGTNDANMVVRIRTEAWLTVDYGKH